MVYIPVYSVYAIYRRDKSVWWTLSVHMVYIPYIVYMPYTEGTCEYRLAYIDVYRCT